jgi:hypothetical protein
MTFRYIEMILFVFGLLLMAMGTVSDSLFLTEIGFLALAIGGATRLIKVVMYRHTYWSLCNIVAGAGMASYFGGGFVVLMTHPHGSAEMLSITGDSLTDKSTTVTIYMLSFYCALILLSIIENRAWQAAFYKISSANSISSSAIFNNFIMYLFATIPICQIYLMVTGQVTSAAVTVLASSASEFRLNIATALVGDISEPLVGMAAWVASTRKRWPVPIVVLAIVVLLVDVVWFGMLGRRVILYGAVVFMTAYLWGQGQQGLRKFVPALLIAPPALMLVFTAWRVFIAMRFSTAQWGEQASLASIGDLLADATDVIFQQSDLISSLEQENYGSRPFILGHLITVMSRLTFRDAQLGTFLFISMFNCIPSAIFPSKTAIMFEKDWGADGKSIINRALGLTNEDFAWSPFVAGYADFMWAGAFFYPVFILFLGLIFAYIIKRFRHPVMMIGGLSVCLTRFISTETTMSALILAGRTIVIMWLAQWLISRYDRAPRCETIAQGDPDEIELQ